MVIDEQQHWRHSIHLLHEIWGKLDLDKGMQLTLVLQFFQLMPALNTPITARATYSEALLCCFFSWAGSTQMGDHSLLISWYSIDGAMFL